MALEIPAGVFDVLNESIRLFTRTVTVSYPPLKEECSNCYLDTLGAGGRSISRYKTGGPYSFEAGMPCPFCNGVGYKEIETTEDLSVRIYWNQQNWYKIGIPINISEGMFQMVAKLQDMAKLERAHFIIVGYDNYSEYRTMKYTRVGDSYPQGFRQNPQKYVISYWQRNG